MSSIHPTSILTDCTIGDGVTVGPFCFLAHTTLQDHVEIEGNVRVENSTIAANSTLLWGALIRESHIGPACVIGCEVKRSTLGSAVKAKHLGTLIGSATVGDRANFGGGSKCANYDGKGKGHFTIGHDVFIGCDVIMSVKAGEMRTIGSQSKIGANIHIDRDIPPSSLVYADRTTGVLTVRENYYAHE